MHPIAVWRNVLRGDRERHRRTTAGHLHNPQQVFRHPQDVAFFHRRRQRVTFVVDDAVAFGGVDRQDCIGFRHHFIVVHRHVVDRRIHKIDRIMRAGWRVRANMGSDNDIPRQHVPFTLHFCQLQRAGNRGNCPVAVGHQTDARRPCTDAAQPADNTQGWRIAPLVFTGAAGDIDAHEIGGAFRSAGTQRTGPDAGIRRKQIDDVLTAHIGIIY